MHKGTKKKLIPNITYFDKIEHSIPDNFIVERLKKIKQILLYPFRRINLLATDS